jgi:hypothetical protein
LITFESEAVKVKMIKQRQVVVVHRFLDSEKDFNFNLGLNFVPTSFIVRSINYRQSTNTGINFIGANFVNSKDNVLGVFIASGVDGSSNTLGDYISNPNTEYDIINPASLMNGGVKFFINRVVDDIVSPGNANGVLSLTLEFLQKEEREDRIDVSSMKMLVDYIHSKSSQQIYSQLPTQLGKGHCNGSCKCMRGGADRRMFMFDEPELNSPDTTPQTTPQDSGDEKQNNELVSSTDADTPEVIDERNPIDQVNPIPNVNQLNVERDIVDEEGRQE